ncbi:MAG: hypothetical protein ACR2JI_05115 [Mycobacterium sp.]
MRKGDYVAPDYVQQWKQDYYQAKKLAANKTTGSIANEMDYLPGGRRYKAPIIPAPVNLDVPAAN